MFFKLWLTRAKGLSKIKFFHWPTCQRLCQHIQARSEIFGHGTHTNSSVAFIACHMQMKRGISMRVLGASDPRKCTDGATMALYYPLGMMFTQTKDFSLEAMTKLTVCVRRMLFATATVSFCISIVMLFVVALWKQEIGMAAFWYLQRFYVMADRISRLKWMPFISNI